MLDKIQLQSLKEIAEKAAIEAGVYAQTSRSANFEVKKKEGQASLAAEVVTEVDIACQQIIIDHLSPSIEQYDLGLLAEESKDDNSRLQKEYFWCVDPLDGTLSFTQGVYGYAVSIALVNRAGESLIGVVYDPVKEVLHSAVHGLGYAREPNTDSLVQDDNQLHLFFDRSMLKHPKYDVLIDALKQYADQQNWTDVQIHTGYGAVLNALSVSDYTNAAYFKIPSERPGGGSIWDFAATTCINQERSLFVFSANGSPINLNDPNNTFMNRQGVVFANQKALGDWILNWLSENTAFIQYG